MKVLWILAGSLHAAAAVAATVARERSGLVRALPLAGLFVALALLCGALAASEVELDSAGGSLALASGVLALFAALGQRRLARAAERARIKAEALEEEQRRYVEESSSHLEASRARFRALAEAAPLGVLELGVDGRCTYASARWSELTGLAREAARDEGWLEVVHADERAAFEAAWRRALDRAEPFSAEFRGAHPAPKTRAFLVQLARRGALGWIGTLSDVSERRAAEDERRRLESRIRHAQKLESLGVLAGGMAHDFNNLLVGILGNLHALKGELPASGGGELYLARAETAALRAAELARDMLNYAGRGGAQRESVDLSAIAAEMVPLLEVSRPAGTELVCELDRELPLLDADPTQVRQLVLNLLTNAFEACAGASCRVAVRTGSSRVGALAADETHTGEPFAAGLALYLEVEDGGRGMSADVVARMFDPFFTTKPRGRGLGLAVVLGVVRKLHGALRVESRPGRGARIRVLFRASGSGAPAAGAGERGAESAEPA